MQPDTLLHIANFSTLFMCMVLKFPQIFVLMRAKSASGVSLKSLLLELIGPATLRQTGNLSRMYPAFAHEWPG